MRNRVQTSQVTVNLYQKWFIYHRSFHSRQPQTQLTQINRKHNTWNRSYDLDELQYKLPLLMLAPRTKLKDGHGKYLYILTLPIPLTWLQLHRVQWHQLALTMNFLAESQSWRPKMQWRLQQVCSINEPRTQHSCTIQLSSSINRVVWGLPYLKLVKWHQNLMSFFFTSVVQLL